MCATHTVPYYNPIAMQSLRIRMTYQLQYHYSMKYSKLEDTKRENSDMA